MVLGDASGEMLARWESLRLGRGRRARLRRDKGKRGKELNYRDGIGLGRY